MKQRPQEISIMGRTFSIRYRKEADNDKDVWGTMDGAEGRITISHTGSCTEDRLESTLLHEITHAVLYCSGISELLSESSERLEEAIVTALENGLFQLYRRR